MTKKFTLSRNERLKSRKLIERVFLEGKNLNASPLRAQFLLMRETDGKRLQFGAVAGRKSFRRAVDRNRIKRLLREAWRMNKQELEAELARKELRLAVFVLYNGKELPGYNVVEEKMKNLLTQLLKSIENTARK